MDFSHIISTVVMPRLVHRKQFAAFGALNRECRKAFLTDRKAFVADRDAQRQAIIDKIRLRNPGMSHRQFVWKLDRALTGCGLMTNDVTVKFIVKQFAGKPQYIYDALKLAGHLSSSLGRDFFVKAYGGSGIHLYCVLNELGLLTNDVPPDWYAWAFSRDPVMMVAALDCAHPGVASDKVWMNARLSKTPQGREFLYFRVNRDTWDTRDLYM